MKQITSQYKGLIYIFLSLDLKFLTFCDPALLGDGVSFTSLTSLSIFFFCLISSSAFCVE